MGIVIVDVCRVNKIMTTDIEKVIEEEFPEVAVIVNECMSYCGLCAATSYAHVNGKLVHGKTPEQCLENIRKKIKEELAIFC